MTNIGPVLFAFFEDHLKVQKGLRLTSVQSYRDTIKLFIMIAFVKASHHYHYSYRVLANHLLASVCIN